MGSGVLSSCSVRCSYVLDLKVFVVFCFVFAVYLGFFYLLLVFCFVGFWNLVGFCYVRILGFSSFLFFMGGGWFLLTFLFLAPLYVA